MLRININGITRVSTDKNGNILGARKGSKYAMNVNIAKMILKKNAILLNQDKFFTCYCYFFTLWIVIYCSFPTLNKNSFSSFVRLS